MDKIKRRIFDIISGAGKRDLKSKIFDVFIIILIIVNTFIIIADTFETIPAAIKSVFYCIEISSLIIFTVEYVLRLWTADFIYEQGGVKARIKYIFSFMAIIDLLSILPFYLPFIFPFDLKILRMIRLLRIFRMFKINRYTNALTTVGYVMKRKAAALISSMAVVSILMIISSVLMYNIEYEARGL